MTAEQILPAVAKMLQARYAARFRAYRASIGMPLPKRRRKARPAPGVLDIAEIEG